MNILRYFTACAVIVGTLGLGKAIGATADTTFRIVESVPENTQYGQPGVQRTQQAWLEMIHGAKQSIDIAAFYFTNKPGEALAPVMNALAARARAGVKIHILVGRAFYRGSESSLAPLKGIDNIQIRILPVDSLTGGVLHAKYFIVDDSIVFVGSQNWDWRALSQIHEIGARIDNKRFAQTFESVFHFEWQLAVTRNLPKAQRLAARPPDFNPVTEGDPVLLHGSKGDVSLAFPAFSPPSLVPRWVDQEQPELVRLIESAKHTVRIQVMTLNALVYYGPKGYWKEIDNALRDVAARGVKVEIIVANWALRQPMQQYLKSLAVMPNITVKFSALPPAPEGFIPYARVEHCKYAVVDDNRAFIGTGNWSWSYFNTTVDASVMVTGKGPAGTLIRIFDRDWNGPYVTNLEPGHQYQAPRNH